MINNRINALDNRGADAVLPAPATALTSSRRAGVEMGWRGVLITMVAAGVVTVGFIMGMGFLLHRFVPG